MMTDRNSLGPLPDAAGPLDDVDVALLGRLRALVDTVDPVPTDLMTRIQFALALENVDVEVCRLTEQLGQLSGVRGEETSRAVTFDSDSTTLMVIISEDGGGVRLDGWLAPEGAYEVELRTDAGPLATSTDGQGRFVLDAVPHGLAQFLIRPMDGNGSTRPVVTPSIVV
jgi:hypothetical protein